MELRTAHLESTIFNRDIVKNAKGNTVGRVCVICNSTVAFHGFTKHLKSKHDIDTHRYCWKYLLKYDSPPKCTNCDNYVYKGTKIGKSYPRTCCRSCLAAESWSNPETAEKYRDHIYNTLLSDKYDQIRSESITRRNLENWQDPQYRDRIIAVDKKSSQTMTMLNLRFAAERAKLGGMTKCEYLLDNYPGFKDLGFKYHGKTFRNSSGNGSLIPDFVNEDKKLIIEVDGWYHETNEQSQRDSAKDKFLYDKYGYSVIRVPNSEIENSIDRVISLIKERIL